MKIVVLPLHPGWQVRRDDELISVHSTKDKALEIAFTLARGATAADLAVELSVVAPNHDLATCPSHEDASPALPTRIEAAPSRINEQIAEAEFRIVEQRERIRQLSDHGFDTAEARRFLERMIDLLEQMKMHRSTLAALPPRPG